MIAHENKYKANYQYRVYVVVGIIFVLISSLFFFFENIVSVNGCLFLLFTFISISILWVVPYEVIVNKDAFLVKMLFRKRIIKYSTVKKITISYSTKSMIWHGGDKKKANMVCYVWPSSNPINIIVINGSIARYHDLCSRLEEKAKNEGQT